MTVFFERIEPSEILNEVMKTISNVKYNICMTMNLREELSNPIKTEYFQLLAEKVSQGVQIERLCFGNSEQYQKFRLRDIVNTQHNYSNTLVKSNFYIRMILIDNNILFFKLFSNYLQTSNSFIIQIFNFYFRSQQ